MHHGPHVHFTYIFTYILVKKYFIDILYIYTHNWCACCLWKPSLSSSLIKGNFCSRGFACTDATEMLFLHRKHGDSKLCAISYSGLANFIYLQWKGIWSAVKKSIILKSMQSWNMFLWQRSNHDMAPPCQVFPNKGSVLPGNTAGEKLGRTWAHGTSDQWVQFALPWFIYICICASVCCFNAKAPWKRMCPQKIIRSISSIIIYIFPYTALHMLMLPHRPVWCFCSGGLHRDHSRCQSCLGRCLSRRAGGAAMRADLQSGFCKGEQIRTLDRPVV